ncbi:alpha/beta fold hydrolase [Bradyrhizobium tunisiense]|uniref:alpha/beta fold hydrolase n=1 Tax=Bradyrhizobium tunisiense TaxID=3278709 RepID=UPI0035E2C511
MIKISGWVPTPRANVVFVHGLMGDAYATWSRSDSFPSPDATFWPAWLSTDIPGLQVFTVSYDAPASNWLGTSMALQDRAVNVLQVLLADETLRKSPTFLICHSLGGLLIKQILLLLKEQEERNPKARDLLASIKKIVFVATPHTGSRKATLLGQLSFLAWPSAIARSLVANDPALRQINVSYRDLADDRRAVLSHLIFYETQETFFGGIVDEASSDPGLQARPIPIDANHITIAKPTDRGAQLYVGTRDFVLEGLPPPSEGHCVPSDLPVISHERSWNLIPKVARLAVMIAMATTAYFYFKPEHFIRPKEDPQEFARSYLALVDRGDFQNAWDLWDPLAKEALGSYEKYRQLAENNLRPLGAMMTRGFVGAPAELVSPSGYPHGLYDGVTYRTRFATANECRAEVVMLRSGRVPGWHVFGHQLSPIAIPC